jgi:hypothetical protein
MPERTGGSKETFKIGGISKGWIEAWFALSSGKGRPGCYFLYQTPFNNNNSIPS